MNGIACRQTGKSLQSEPLVSAAYELICCIRDLADTVKDSGSEGQAPCSLIVVCSGLCD